MQPREASRVGEPPKLLDRVRTEIRARHYSPRTEETYINWIKRFILFHGKRHPASMGPDEVNAFLSNLAVEGHVSATTQNQALSAVLFLYRYVLRDPLPWIADIVRAQRPERVPVVLTPEEARAVIDDVQGVSRLVVQLLYGSGLRLLEALQLRVKDLDFRRGEVLVRDPKGRHDRVTTLPRVIDIPLRAHLEKVRRIHDEDLRLGFGSVVLPTAIDRTFPNADRDWVWQWVFPATSRYVDEARGTERRHHLHESAVQRAVHVAAMKAGMTKRVTCHTFRHHADCRIMPMVSSACVLLVTGSNASGVCERGMIGVSSPKPTLAKKG
ncbi:MAG TPA: integron integrase, partial [Thermoanaerobaculia bacterium]